MELYIANLIAQKKNLHKKLNRELLYSVCLFRSYIKKKKELLKIFDKNNYHCFLINKKILKIYSFTI